MEEQPIQKKSDATKVRLGVFIGILAVVCIVINVLLLDNARVKKERKATAEKAVHAAQEAQAAAVQKSKDATTQEAAKKANYVARYVGGGYTKKPGMKALAIVTAAEHGNRETTIQEALARRFRCSGVDVVTSFFQPAFITDGLFNKALNGDALSELQLAQSLDGLLLAQFRVEYSTNTTEGGTITANAELQIALVPVAGSIQSDSWALSANGIGFKPQEARSLAVERLVNQIANNPKISLTP